jgi:long-chain acyl-CoA synthetase
VRILLTGATGFVGMQVLARLVARGEEVVCLVRGEQPERRVHDVLDLLGVAAGRDGVTVVAGDVAEPFPDVGALDAVVHAAASISFGLELEEARRINVGGTRNALEAARRAGARYVHVSTAYVAGRTRGRFTEDQLMVGQAFRNTYEQSKAEAEQLVDAAGLDAVVLRPSIIVGEARTGWTPVFNVLYWPLRAFARGLWPTVPARPDARVDVVPVDYVAEAITHVVCERPDVQGRLHLVSGEEAVTVDELVDLACAGLRRERPQLVPVPDGGLVERSVQAARYVPYFDIEVVFDDRRARAVLDPAGIFPSPLATYFDRLIRFAQQAAWGKARLARAA